VRYLLTTFAALVVCVAACDGPGFLLVDLDSPPGIVIYFAITMDDSDVASFILRNNLVLHQKHFSSDPYHPFYRFLVDRKTIPIDSMEADIALYLKHAYPDTIDRVFPDPNKGGW
jgi:hypothetical protein